MSKLTIKQIEGHEKALELLKKESLTHDEKLYVFENYREDAIHMNSKEKAFFTPFWLANDLKLHIPYIYGKTIKILDLCAGIGVLSYAATLECDSWSTCSCEITCIEINPDYVEVGKKLLPDAKWICSDALEPGLLEALGHFDCVIANLPYGIGAPTKKYKGKYSSNRFEYMIIEAAAKIADCGVFLIPQTSAPFVYSGTNQHTWQTEGRAIEFEKKTGFKLDINVGIDTEQYRELWHNYGGTLCEIVCVDYTEQKEDEETECDYKQISLVY